MRPVLLALLVCLGAAAPARAEVITFASTSGLSATPFTLGDFPSWEVTTGSILRLPTGTVQFNFPTGWPPSASFGDLRFPSRPLPSKVPEPGTLSLVAIGALALYAKRRAAQPTL